jgi:rRNA maturation protein Nop10
MNESVTLADMREKGVYSVIATCEDCGHKSNENVDALPETLVVPEAGLRLRCSQCGGKRIDAQPAWHIAPAAPPPGARGGMTGTRSPA